MTAAMIDRLRWEAARCRDLAEGIGRSDPTRQLVKMAEAFEAEAAMLEAVLSGGVCEGVPESTRVNALPGPHSGTLGPAVLPSVPYAGAT